MGSTGREGDLGCSPVTVKRFSVWKHQFHLFRQVHPLEWLPVWKCLPFLFSLFSSLLLLFSVFPLSVHLPIHAFNRRRQSLSLCQSLAGSAVWEHAGERSRHLRPVHGSELSFSERQRPLREAHQWGFPQWGHENHVRCGKSFFLCCLLLCLDSKWRNTWETKHDG